MTKTIKSPRKVLINTVKSMDMYMRDGKVFDPSRPLGDQMPRFDDHYYQKAFCPLFLDKVRGKFNGASFSSIGLWNDCLAEKINPLDFVNRELMHGKSTIFLSLSAEREGIDECELVYSWDEVFQAYLATDFSYAMPDSIIGPPKSRLSKGARLFDALIDAIGFDEFLLKSSLTPTLINDWFREIGEFPIKERANRISSLVDALSLCTYEHKQPLQEAGAQIEINGLITRVADCFVAAVRQIPDWVSSGIESTESYLLGEYPNFDMLMKTGFPDADVRFNKMEALIGSNIAFLNYQAISVISDNPHLVANAMAMLNDQEKINKFFSILLNEYVSSISCANEAVMYVNIYREFFIEHGLPDFKGTDVMRPLAKKLDLAEIFLRLDFFPKDFTDFRQYLGSLDKDVVNYCDRMADASVVARKYMDVAMLAGRPDVILDVFEDYFKGHHQPIRHDVVEAMLVQAVDEKMFDNDSLVRTPQRMMKLASLGVSREVMTEMKLFMKVKAQLIRDDMGI